MAAIPAPMAPSTANWHWKNKNVTPWAKAWFERELTTISVKEGEDEVFISEVVEVDGDVELGQRKSKCVCGSGVTQTRVLYLLTPTLSSPRSMQASHYLRLQDRAQVEG